MQKPVDISKKFRFRNFRIYTESRKISFEIKKLVKGKFPREEQFALTSQLSRALDSIILNIAEGADRSTDKDFALFLNRSHTSLNEVVACLDIALDNSYINEKELEMCILKLADLGNQITAFRKILLTKPTK